MAAPASAAVRMPSRRDSTRAAGSSTHWCCTSPTRTGAVAGSWTRARDSGTPSAWMSFTASSMHPRPRRLTASRGPCPVLRRRASVGGQLADEPAVADLAHRGDDAVLVDGGSLLRLGGGGLVDERHDAHGAALPAVAARVHDAGLVDLGLHRRLVLDRHRLDV